ncbi:GDP-mannose-dependent alpha-(1-2)-phosphatidylinositol mannosyltransferase [compost metagenome]
MKIRIELGSLTAQSQSGVANYTRLLAEALDRHNDTTVFGSYFNFLDRHITPRVSLKQPLEKSTIIPLRVYTKLQSYNVAPAFDLFSPRVDVTIFPNFATWPTAKSSLRGTTIHDLTYLYYPELVEVKNLEHLRRVVPRSIKQADFIITVSEAVKAELVKEFNLSSNKCIVTHIPPDPSYFKKNTNEIHSKYKIPTKKYLYFIGNLEPRKNLPVLIEAYRQLPQEMKDEYSLVLGGGNGWKTEKSRECIQAAQDAGENVIHIGFVDTEDTGALYQNASLFIMPSLYEGFGMPILEAFASKIPVVASDIPVLREVAGEGALYAHTDHPEEFAKAMQEVLTSQKLKEKLIANGSKQLKTFSWEKNAQTIVDKVQSLHKVTTKI